MMKKCIENLIRWTKPLAISKTPKIAKQRRQALNNVIVDVFSAFGEESEFAQFYNATLSTYSKTFPPDIQNAYYHLTNIADNERKNITDEDLIQMYETFATTFPGGLPSGGQLVLAVYPFKTPSTLNIKTEIQQATSEGCKKCEELGFAFTRCKNLCYRSICN